MSKDTSRMLLQPLCLRRRAYEDATSSSSLEDLWKAGTLDDSIGNVDRRRFATGRTKALSAVRDELDAVLVGQLTERMKITTCTKPVNSDDSCSLVRQTLYGGFGRQHPCVGINICNNWHETFRDHGVRSRSDCSCRNYDLVASLRSALIAADGLQSRSKRVRAACKRDDRFGVIVMETQELFDAALEGGAMACVGIKDRLGHIALSAKKLLRLRTRFVAQDRGDRIMFSGMAIACWEDLRHRVVGIKCWSTTQDCQKTGACGRIHGRLQY